MGRRSRHSSTALAALTLLACSERAPATPTRSASCWTELDASPQAVRWNIIGEPVTAADGTSAPVSIPVSGEGGALILRVTDASGAGACVQLDSVVAPDATAWVRSGSGDFGPYCTRCAQRVSVGIGYGLFILPSNDRQLAFPATLEVSAGLRDCSTFLRPDADRAGTRLRIEALATPPVSPQRAGSLALGLAFLSDSPLADPAAREALLPEVLRKANALLSPGALSLTVVRTRSVEGTPGFIALERGDNNPLDALYAEVLGDDDCPRPLEDGWIPVVFAGCLEIHDPLQQTTDMPNGLTPGIPSGFPPPGRAHGIYLKGRSCRPTGDPIHWSAASLATLLAHELGHYLGLYHSVEADGTLDQLADTDGSDLMNYDPLNVATPTFTASQFEVMRRHPAIRWNATR